MELLCYLQDLFTAPDYRGHGIGRALIERVYEIAKEAGCKRVYWQTHTTNTPGRTLYDKVAKTLRFHRLRQRRVMSRRAPSRHFTSVRACCFMRSAPRSVSFIAFVAANCITDVESIYNVLRGNFPVHRFLHTFVGAALVRA